MMRTTWAPGDLAKLPKWAQLRITAMEGQLADLRELVETGPETSDTFRYNYPVAAATPLGRGPRIRFIFADPAGHNPDAIEVYAERGRLLVMGIGTQGLAIAPQSSNVVQIRSERWQP